MAEIKLICSGCGAQFTLPQGAIPAAGRQVSCNRCGHVWMARPPAPDTPLDLGAFTNSEEEDEGQPAPAPLSPARKRLSPEILDLLRDEARREQQLRQSETVAPAPTEAGPTPEPDKVPRQPMPPSGRTGHRPPYQPPHPPVAPAPMSIEADPVRSPPYPATEDGDISRGPVAGDDIDWPATTVTLPAGSTRSMTPMAQPPVIYPAPPVVPPQPARTHPQPAGDRADDRTSDPRADPDDDPQDAPAALHRGQPHAAMLTPAPVLRPAPVAPQRADLPALIPEAAPQPGGGYRAGFLLALVTVLVLAGLYLLAPVDEASPSGGWRADLDQTRRWLQGLFR